MNRKKESFHSVIPSKMKKPSYRLNNPDWTEWKKGWLNPKKGLCNQNEEIKNIIISMHRKAYWNETWLHRNKQRQKGWMNRKKVDSIIPSFFRCSHPFFPFIHSPFSFFRIHHHLFISFDAITLFFFLAIINRSFCSIILLINRFNHYAFLSFH